MKPLLALILGMFLAADAHAQMPPPPHMITVSGEADTQTAPDQAILSVSLVSKNANLNEAKRHNDAMVEKLVGIAREFKVPKEKIATSGLYIAPEYTYDQKTSKPQFAGYTVSRSLRVTMDDLSIHERVLSAIVDAKIDQVNGIEFALAEPEKHMQPVRTKAFENARAKAETLAKAAGVKLGRVISISTIGDSRPMPPMPMMRAMHMDAAESSSVAPSLPGMVTLRESVNVTFALE